MPLVDLVRRNYIPSPIWFGWTTFWATAPGTGAAQGRATWSISLRRYPFQKTKCQPRSQGQTLGTRLTKCPHFRISNALLAIQEAQTSQIFRGACLRTYTFAFIPRTPPHPPPPPRGERSKRTLRVSARASEHGPYRTGTCFVYFTFEICHQLKCCSAIGLVGVLVKFLRTSLLQRFRMLNLSCLEAGHLGKQVGGTKEAVSSYLIKLSERLPCVSDLTDDPCGRY